MSLAVRHADGAVRPRPFVSIAMPALNEEAHIEDAVRSVMPRSGAIDWELMVLDGGSSDATRDVVRRLAAEERRIRLVSNEKRLQAAAVNLAARLADPRARYLVRADCHAAYPADFVERCVAALDARGAASVVVPMTARGEGTLQAAIAAAQNSRLGNGGAAHRTGGVSGYVEHGHHAAFDREAFLAVGGYDERFTTNEDAELDARIVASGRLIYLDGGLAIDYFPRATLAGLARQYFAYGRGRARNLMKNRTPPRLRQLLPVAVVSGVAVTLAMATFDLRFLVFPMFYALACLVWGAALALKERAPGLLLSGVAAMTMHFAWGSGFIAEVVGEAAHRLAPPRDGLPQRGVGR